MNLTKIKLSYIAPIVLSIVVQSFATTSLKTDVQKQSYSLGASTGGYISNQIYAQIQLGAKVDVDLVVKGFEDALKQKLKISEAEVIENLNKRADLLNKVQKQKIKKLQIENAKKQKAFLVKNAKRPGVKVTKSGLQYEVIKDSSKGEKPKAESIVIMNYKASLINGHEFDNTYKRKAPAHLSMINIIDGLKEGLMLMHIGSKYKFYIPSKLAYKNVQMRDIPPNSILIFEVELSKVLKPGAMKLKSNFSMTGHGTTKQGNPKVSK
ncbi:FKBP-type peptidyl-prolyl cis-trans isomerase [Arcobacter sp. CECT 8985]|uniref:FKBP-type peptidyl-prolyl cis-trans isomerase n=1 Tax=Arcobacter sp. CECT 8985 TaxID=1935424 RepID=UPI00100BC95A|nr:FKBP-type peptidyl-prolyl cis-trans isomerase [Arcobacter sp. CECT 8985]RXJ87137.1 peptidylprolyl isomerase [Arcobacter sp. CECT 8985]